MLEQHERLVVRRVAERRTREDAAVELVAVAARFDVMFNCDGRIIYEPPPRTTNRQAQRELPEQLGAAARETVVELQRPEERRTVRAVRALEHVDVARRPGPKVMIADHAAE